MISRNIQAIVALLLWVGCVSVSSFTMNPHGSMARTITTELAAITVIEDSKGNEVIVGSIVKVAKEGLKAYQVQAKGFGSFVDGTFVAAEQDGPRGSKNLLLPLGMRGVVTKLYDVEVISSNCPIQVKFQPGKHDNEFEPPVPFLMHFSADEVEAV